METYGQLSAEERGAIMGMKTQGMSARRIGKALSRRRARSRES